MEPLKQILSGRPSIIARSKDGGLTPGYLEKAKSLTRGTLKMSDLEGRPIDVDIETLKGVFFVRDFVGNRTYLEKKTLSDEPERVGLRVRLRFEDNETLEGVAENALDLLQPPGFFFWPGDPESNNRLIFVVTSALLGFRVLGVKHK